MLDRIIKYGLYSLVFLLPLFFLPLTVFPVILNKQMLLSAFVFLLFILWMLKVMISGKLSLAWGKLSKSIFLFLIILTLSTVLSGSKIQSFWGMSFEPDTLFSFILYAFGFFLFANLLKKEDVLKVILAFLASSGVLSLFFLIQAFWRPVFPWGFTQSLGFNPVGSVQSLAVFLGGAFVVLMALVNSNQLSSNVLVKGVAGLLGLLLFLSIFLINHWVVWLGIIWAMAVILWGMARSLKGAIDQGDFKRFIFPLLIFALSLTFLIIKLPTGNIVNLPAEIMVTNRATFDIAKETLQEGPKNLILGSGPATFGYQYSLYRSAGPNLTDFWQIRFSQGATAFLTFLTTFGILGILAILSIVAIFFWQALKMLKGAEIKLEQMLVFIGGFYFLICWFFYSINLSLIFLVFLMLGLWARMNSPVKEFLFTQSPQKAFLIMLLGVILVVVSVVATYDLSQRYMGAISYAQGLELINRPEPKLDEGITKISRAVGLDPRDIYLRDFSQAFLLKINEVFNNQELSQEEKQQIFQQIVSNAEISAQTAVQVNPQNSQNWLQLGSVYGDLASFSIEGTEQLAVLNYQKALELDPQNPQIPLNIGRVYKSAAERIKIQLAILEQTEEKDEEKIKELNEASDKNLDLAIEHFEKSIELKIDFTPAYYLMAQVYEIQEDKEKALENYLIVLQFEPGNEEIQSKVEELSQ